MKSGTKENRETPQLMKDKFGLPPLGEDCEKDYFSQYLTAGAGVSGSHTVPKAMRMESMDDGGGDNTPLQN